MKLKREPRLCKATYTEDDTGRQVACNEVGPPRRAVYQLKGGGYYCHECWGKVVDAMLAKHPGRELIARKGLAQMTKRLKA